VQALATKVLVDGWRVCFTQKTAAFVVPVCPELAVSHASVGEGCRIKFSRQYPTVTDVQGIDSG
jgi:hypothetical protein